MAEREGYREYYKLLAFVFLFGYAGTIWGGLTYYIGVPMGLMNHLKANSAQIGLISALFWGGFAIPQIFAAYSSESLRIKKKYVAWSLGLSSMGFLAAGLYIFATGAANARLSIWIFILCFAWAAIVAGFYIPGYYSMVFKLVPSNRLGQLLGIMFAIEYGGLFLTGFTMDAVNARFQAPDNYAIAFIATFVLTLVSLLLLLVIKEPEGETVKTAPTFPLYLKDFFSIYWKDGPFTMFIFGKWLMSGHIIMLAFLLSYLIQERGFSIERAGWFTALKIGRAHV